MDIFFKRDIQEVINYHFQDELFSNSIDIDDLIDDLRIIINRCSAPDLAYQEAKEQISQLVNSGSLNREDSEYVISELYV